MATPATQSSGSERIEARITTWMARHGATATRISLGVVFLWFGALKLFPGLSPAEGLAGKTILLLTGGLVAPSLSVPILGAWESLMGLSLLVGRGLRLTLISFFAHMAGTITPIALIPGDVFAKAPFALTLEGQYIIKNLVLISAAIVVGSTVRGRSLHVTAHRGAASMPEVAGLPLNPSFPG